MPIYSSFDRQFLTCTWLTNNLSFLISHFPLNAVFHLPTSFSIPSHRYSGMWFKTLQSPLFCSKVVLVIMQHFVFSISPTKQCSSSNNYNRHDNFYLPPKDYLYYYKHLRKSEKNTIAKWMQQLKLNLARNQHKINESWKRKHQCKWSSQAV